MTYPDLIEVIANILKKFDGERPIHKMFQPGIGPFGEPQIVQVISKRLADSGILAKTKRCPDLEVSPDWAIEFKIVRPFGDNGNEAENWTVNMLHPYPGNTSLIGDAIKLSQLLGYEHKGLCVLGFEHNPAKISLDPLIKSFEVIAVNVMGIRMSERIEETRYDLVHPQHQVLRCIGWELLI